MQNLAKKTLTFSLRLSMIVLLYGILFQKMHWPYGLDLMLIGSLFMAFLYAVRFISKKNKVRIDYVKLAIVFVWTIGFLLARFTRLHLPYVFETLLILLCGWWLVEEGVSYFRKRKLIDNGIIKFFYYGLFSSAACLIVIGYIIKILHWPYGNLLFTLGFLLLSIMLIVDYFVVKQQ